jgi:hypothetical protein
VKILAVGVDLVPGDRDFDQWVCERLARWPTLRILQLERWLHEHDESEFVPAVREALRRRGVEPLGEPVRRPKRGVDDLVRRLTRLVHARAQLQVDGGSVVEIDAHTAEIERLRAQLAEAVKESAA